MHRSRPALLVILAAFAACSTRDDSEAIAALSQDTTLARLDVREQALQQPLPDACGTVASVARPAAAEKREAEELSRQAYAAELLGKVEEARSLLRRASALDGTDQLVAYHLGRTSEELGERDAAVAAYCHYLTLSPTTAVATDARQRLAGLSQQNVQVATGSVGSSVAVRRRATTVAARGRARATHAAERRVVTAASVRQASESGSTSHRMSDDGEVVATEESVPAVTQSPVPSRTQRRGPTRVQGAGIGAITGAIIGAAAGRSVKSAVIGAAAGGILGTVVAGASH